MPMEQHTPTKTPLNERMEQQEDRNTTASSTTPLLHHLLEQIFGSTLWELLFVTQTGLFIAITIAVCTFPYAGTGFPTFALDVISAVLLAIFTLEVVLRGILFGFWWRFRNALEFALVGVSFALQIAVVTIASPAVLVASLVFRLLFILLRVKRVHDFYLDCRMFAYSSARSEKQMNAVERCLHILAELDAKHAMSETDSLKLQWIAMVIASRRLYFSPFDAVQTPPPQFHGADADTSNWLLGTYTQVRAGAVSVVSDAAAPPQQQQQDATAAKQLVFEDDPPPQVLPKRSSGAGSSFSTNRLARTFSNTVNTRRNSSVGGDCESVVNFTDVTDLTNLLLPSSSTTGGARITTGANHGLLAQDLTLILCSDEEEEVLNKPQVDWDRFNREMDEWDFDPFYYEEVSNGHALATCLLSALRKNVSLDALNIPLHTLVNFTLEIERGYLTSNVYHNRVHAADVVQAFHHLLTHTQMRQCTTPMDRLAGLLACAIHDYKHPGVNNVFLIQTNHALAIEYNDISVLESMHVSSAFALMRNNPAKFDLFANLPPAAQREARETMVQMVLATDMKSHFDILNTFKTAIVNSAEPEKSAEHVGSWWNEMDNNISGSFSSQIFSQQQPVVAHPIEYRRTVLKTALHCADVSNPARPTALAIKLAELVQEEFFRQGDLEKEHKLPVSLFMDRDKPAFPKMQVGFIEFIVRPLLDSYMMWLKPYKGSVDLNLVANLEYWKQRAAAEQEAATGSPPVPPPTKNKAATIPRQMRPAGGASSLGEMGETSKRPMPHHRRTNSDHQRTFAQSLSVMVAAAAQRGGDPAASPQTRLQPDSLV